MSPERPTQELITSVPLTQEATSQEAFGEVPAPLTGADIPDFTPHVETEAPTVPLVDVVPQSSVQSVVEVATAPLPLVEGIPDELGAIAAQRVISEPTRGPVEVPMPANPHKVVGYSDGVNRG